jgi:hypothetical protein
MAQSNFPIISTILMLSKHYTQRILPKQLDY